MLVSLLLSRFVVCVRDNVINVVRDLLNERSCESDGERIVRSEKKQDLSGINSRQSVSVLRTTSYAFPDRTCLYTHEHVKYHCVSSLTCEETFLRFLRSSNASSTTEFDLTPFRIRSVNVPRRCSNYQIA